MKEQIGNYPCAEPQLQMRLTKPQGAAKETHGDLTKVPQSSHRTPIDSPQSLTEPHRDPQSFYSDPWSPMDLPQSPTENHGARKSFEENIPFSF